MMINGKEINKMTIRELLKGYRNGQFAEFHREICLSHALERIAEQLGCNIDRPGV